MFFQEQVPFRANGPQAFKLPSLSLPKGGGAIRGMGETFAENPVTGTVRFTVPISISPGRDDFAPQLVLSYDSGSGQGPFGFGWNLDLPAITRKTDNGLPQYLDESESDVFLLSGSEDLVPVHLSDGTKFCDDVTVAGYRIHRYHPRIEGSFARIERWTRLNDGDVHWRVFSKDDILTIYGLTSDSRIADPDNPQRIYSWLICESRDHKGNAILYEYKAENGSHVDLTLACEQNRGDRSSRRRSANRYLKRIFYGNRKPLLDEDGRRPRFLTDGQRNPADWLFQVVFDYGEHDAAQPRPVESGEWPCRPDPFSTYRPGFEVRTYRLCRRVLMFHHFPDEPGVGADCLVRSTRFEYRESPIASFLVKVTQSGHKWMEAARDAAVSPETEGAETEVPGAGEADGGSSTETGGAGETSHSGESAKKIRIEQSLPPLEFEYSEAVIGSTVEEVREGSLPVGLDGRFQWVDLDGEGLTGILSEQGGCWYYSRNETDRKPAAGEEKGAVRFGPPKLVDRVPAGAALSGQIGKPWRFADLEGDGQPDVVQWAAPLPGFYERDPEEGWKPFRAFTAVPNLDLTDPHLQWIDLTGDGRADVIVSENHALTWYPSRGEEGYGEAVRVSLPSDEEKGPRAVWADAGAAIFLADMSGDGLADLVRIRNGEVCYWPNLGYGRFGDKVTMDNAPWFEVPDQFNPANIRLADIDGSGVTDIVYLGSGCAVLWFNQSGNAWSEPHKLPWSPPADSIASANVLDLLGSGTACLVWTSRMPGASRTAIQYINLMKEGKPHLLVSVRNNLGAETRFRYVPSTYFYLQDKSDGKPWATKLPFPVHVLERVETIDHISRNRFVTRYAYHHGYFDEIEREFCGFGMVEQWDTESFAAFSKDGAISAPANADAAFHVPPVYTKTWYHIGAITDSDLHPGRFTGFPNVRVVEEYYREPGMSGAQAGSRLLPDARIPAGLRSEEQREAYRSLKGMMLRQEIYALDGTPKEKHPYTVVEQTSAALCLQHRFDGKTKHAVFFPHVVEAITYHYERNPHDPRVTHTLTIETDRFGNMLKEARIDYGRRLPDASLLREDQQKQARTYIAYTENSFTNPIGDAVRYTDHYRLPLPAETRVFELTGYAPTGPGGRFRLSDLARIGSDRPELIYDREISYEMEPDHEEKQRRLLDHTRTLYRKDDLTGLLPLGRLEPLALIGETYKLALTSGLLDQMFQRNGEKLIPSPSDVLAGAGADRGGYLSGRELKQSGRFPAGDPDEVWWASSGRVFLSPRSTDTAAEELAYARKHFFRPCRYRDPFHTELTSTESVVAYDPYDLLLQESCDSLGNRVTAGERRPDGSRDNAKSGNDYRVLQPWLLTDPNGNRSGAVYDALGLVTGTALMGRRGENVGDSLQMEAVLPDRAVTGHFEQPLADPQKILGRATTRLVYDLFAYMRTKDEPDPQPAAVCLLMRERHEHELEAGEQPGIQQQFIYSDGFGRVIQTKIRTAPGEQTGANEPSPRWKGSGWVIFNNKGKPVRQYEPFFSGTRKFEFGVKTGVSPVVFYDPLGREIAVLYPNHTYEKTIFDPWRKITFDTNDTSAPHGTETGDPRTDPDIRGFVAAYLEMGTDASWRTWYEQRRHGDMGAPEQTAAVKASAHADTPTTIYFDSLGRPFLTLKHNGRDPAGAPICYAIREELDIEGNRLALRDAVVQDGAKLGRVVLRAGYDMLGNVIRQDSMEAGSRWTLPDAAGRIIRSWDSRGHAFRTEFDPLRRPVRTYTAGIDSSDPDREWLTERQLYGEQHPEAEKLGLRGNLYLQLDQAGAASNDSFDFKGNLIQSSRRLAAEYDATVDWSAVDAVLPAAGTARFDPAELEAALAALTEQETFVGFSRYDALNRPVRLTAPHTSDMPASHIRMQYDEEGLLNRVETNVRGEIRDGRPAWNVFVSRIVYNAKGMRTRIDYGNGTSTLYEYDPLTFRLVRLLTRRDETKFPGDRPDPLSDGWPGSHVQNLHYTYDAVGNVTHVRDDAQQTVFFRNKRVDPDASYTYDALYRLIEASGREHLGQAGAPPSPHSFADAPRAGLGWAANDGKAMGRYTETYVYDAAGNMLEMRHRGTDPAHPGWKRRFVYEEPGLIEDGSNGSGSGTNNRLSRVVTGDDASAADSFIYDAHGNLLRLPHLGGTHPDANMHWDAQDRLRRIDLGGGGTVYYAYDAGGRRIRKVWVKSPGRMEERIDFGGFELYRRRNGAGETTLERESLHVMAGQQRIALIETRTVDTEGTDPAPPRMIRYQYGNHLGSVGLELDEQAQIISYEEYTPYGSTAYQAVRSETETPKRYRYTGKERDEESGMYYHGARYYIPWLARWASADPAGVNTDATNLFVYVDGNPITYHDPTGNDKESGFWKEVVYGDFHEGESTWTGTAANSGVGLIPFVGQAADARDTAAAAKGVWKNPTSGGAWLNLAGALAGWVPLVGDAAKSLLKVEKKAAKQAAKQGAEETSKKLMKETAQQTARAPVYVKDWVNDTLKKMDQIKEEAAEKTAKQAEIKAAAPGLGEQMIKESERSGLNVDLAVQEHRHKSKYRKGSGKKVESAHMVNSSSVNELTNYVRDRALTVLLPKDAHKAFDDYWKNWARKKLQQAKPGEEVKVTVAEWEKVLNEAAESVPALRGRTADAMSVLIRTELYQTLGLKPDQLIRLPYAK
jgi:RHS repeat-associated protein